MSQSSRSGSTSRSTSNRSTHDSSSTNNQPGELAQQRGEAEEIREIINLVTSPPGGSICGLRHYLRELVDRGINVDSLLLAIRISRERNLVHLAMGAPSEFETRESLSCIGDFTTLTTRERILNAGDSFGLTPLRMACGGYGNASLFEKLVSLGATSDFGLLHRAIQPVNRATRILNDIVLRLDEAGRLRNGRVSIRRLENQERLYGDRLDRALDVLEAVAHLYRMEGRSFDERERGEGREDFTPAHVVAREGCLAALKILVRYSGGNCIRREIRTPEGESVYQLVLNNRRRDMERWIRHHHGGIAI